MDSFPAARTTRTAGAQHSHCAEEYKRLVNSVEVTWALTWEASCRLHHRSMTRQARIIAGVSWIRVVNLAQTNIGDDQVVFFLTQEHRERGVAERSQYTRMASIEAATPLFSAAPSSSASASRMHPPNTRERSSPLTTIGEPGNFSSRSSTGTVRKLMPERQTSLLQGTLDLLILRALLASGHARARRRAPCSSKSRTER